MIDEVGWKSLRRLFGATFSSSLHFSVGSVGANGEPVVTPIGSVLLHEEPGRASYFELYSHGLGARLTADPRLCVVAVDSSRWLWLRALWRGRFPRLAAIRLRGRAEASLRPADDDERQRMLKRIRGVRRLKGGRLLWSDFDCPVRDIWIDDVNTVGLGKLTFNQAGVSACRYPWGEVSSWPMAEPSGPHDVGGQSAGPVDLSEHDTAHWEWQIDAMVRLALAKGLLTDFAELRDGIERLTTEDYDKLSYYERWARSLAYALVDKGIVAQADLDAKVSQIAARQEQEDGQ